MRFYALLNLQHVILYIFPTLVFILLFGLGLSYAHFHTQDAEERKNRIIHRFPDDLEERKAPFPLVIMLIIAGTLIWAFFYILGTGLTGVKI
jgi:hypothetical protein